MEDYNNLTKNAEGYICSDCGADVSENDKVCPKCGADLTEIVVPDVENFQSAITPNKIINNTTHTFHSERHYKTAFTLAKIIEVISWLILLGGVLAGIALASSNQLLGILIIFLSVIFGLTLVFIAQLILIFIDTENNTRRSADEIVKTNAMLTNTLGAIVSNLDIIVKNYKEEK